MPLVEVTLTEGRTPQDLRELIHRVHEAVVNSVQASPENVRVIVREVPQSLWAAGDQTLAERDAAKRAATAPDGNATKTDN